MHWILIQLGFSSLLQYWWDTSRKHCGRELLLTAMTFTWAYYAWMQSIFLNAMQLETWQPLWVVSPGLNTYICSPGFTNTLVVICGLKVYFSQLVWFLTAIPCDLWDSADLLVTRCEDLVTQYLGGIERNFDSRILMIWQFIVDVWKLSRVFSELMVIFTKLLLSWILSTRWNGGG